MGNSSSTQRHGTPPTTTLLDLPNEVFDHIISCLLPEDARTLTAYLKPNKREQSCLPFHLVCRSFHTGISSILYHDSGRAELTIDFSYDYCQRERHFPYEPQHRFLWQSKGITPASAEALARFSRIHLYFPFPPHAQDLEGVNKALNCFMPLLKMQLKRIKRGDLVIRATLEAPRSPENLPKGAHLRQYWTYARMVSIVLPLRPLFDILDVHPLEIVDVPEIACRLPVGSNNLENMIYGKQYLLWVLGRGFEQDQVMQITSILDPESDWDYQMLVKDLRLDYRNDGRRLNKARVTRLLTYEDDELASLLIEVEASRFALSQRSRTGCRKLDDELSTLLSELREIRKALVIWLWEAGTGLDDMRDSIQQCEVARDLWQDAVEAEKARQKTEVAKKTRESI